MSETQGDDEMSDQQGLDEAYKTPEGVYVAGNTEYVAGTKSFRDAVDDLAIPCHRPLQTYLFGPRATSITMASSSA